MMSKAVVEVKKALAAKYWRLSRASSSKVKRVKYANKAKEYTHQAGELARQFGAD